jgi:hypothetical protein
MSQGQQFIPNEQFNTYLSTLTEELRTKPLSAICDVDDELLNEVARAVAACKMRKLGSGENNREGMEGRREEFSSASREQQGDEFEFTTPKKWGAGTVRGVQRDNPGKAAEGDGGLRELEDHLKGMDMGGQQQQQQQQQQQPAIKIDEVVKGMGGFTIGKRDEGGRKKGKNKKVTGKAPSASNANKVEGGAGKGVFVFGASPEKATVLPPPPPPQVPPAATNIGGVGLGLGFFPTTANAAPNPVAQPQQEAPQESAAEATEEGDDMEVTVEEMEDVMKQGLRDGIRKEDRTAKVRVAGKSNAKGGSIKCTPSYVLRQPFLRGSLRSPHPFCAARFARRPQGTPLPAEDLTGKFNAFTIGVSEKSPEDKKKERRGSRRKASSSGRASASSVNTNAGAGMQGGSLADR